MPVSLSPLQQPPTPHREDNTLVDTISGWPSAGATSNRPQSTLATTDRPRFYQRPLSSQTYSDIQHVSDVPNTYPYSSSLQLSNRYQSDFNKQSSHLDYLATKRLYSASTQTAWDEINWNKKLHPTFKRTIPQNNPHPDPVANSNRIQRYYPASNHWQKLGNSWDYIQSRKIVEIKDVDSEFISPYRKSFQVPGYTGHNRVGTENVISRTQLGTPKEILNYKSTHFFNNISRTSRGANIPGYSGCQHWTQSRPTNQKMDHAGIYSSTTPREYVSFHSQYSRISPFARNGILSKMVTLTNPYNPFVNQP